MGVHTLSTENTNRELYRLDPTIYANTAANVLGESAIQSTKFGKELGNIQGRTFWGNVDFQDYDYQLNHATSTQKTTNYSVGVGTTTATGIGVGVQLDAGKLKLDDAVYGIQNSTDTNMVGLTVGANKQVGGMDVSGWLKGATTSTDSNRHGTTTKGDFDGRLYGVGVQVGKQLQLDPKTAIKPYAFLNHQQYDYNGSFDDGKNTIHDITAKQSQLGVGVDATYQLANNWEVFGGAQLANSFNKDAKLTTSYTGTSTPVVFDHWDTGKTRWSAKVGTNYHLSPNSQVGLSYDHTSGKHDDAGRINIGFTSKF